MEKIIGTDKYFVHKGTWENNYEWRIQLVTITGVKINKDNEAYAEFSFSCIGYEYPISHLKDTLEEAKKFAIEEIKLEKSNQIKKIKQYNQNI